MAKSLKLFKNSEKFSKLSKSSKNIPGNFQKRLANLKNNKKVKRPKKNCSVPLIEAKRLTCPQEVVLGFPCGKQKAKNDANSLVDGQGFMAIFGNDFQLK